MKDPATGRTDVSGRVSGPLVGHGGGRWLLAHMCAAALVVIGAAAGGIVEAAPPGELANEAGKPANPKGALNVAAAVTVTVTVTGLRNNKGVVYCKLHDRRTTFPSRKHASIRPTKARPANRQAVCTYINIPKGRYAVVIAHDENGNGKIDTNFIGIPKEGYGFSNNVRPFLSAPSFNSAGFPVTGDVTVTIRVIYR
jgi:uncharacterized protein (DUF2141 family)